MISSPLDVTYRMGTAPAPAVSLRVSHTWDGCHPDRLVEVARRDNPKRAVLFVSRVLGKHLAVDPVDVLAAGAALGERVVESLRPPSVALCGEVGADAVVVGYAETATALGHAVRRHLGPGQYVHTTRAAGDPDELVLRFDETHSHVPAHRLFHRDPRFLRDRRPVVLVDDELTTGRTVLTTIRAIQQLSPRERYLVAVLTDLRTAQARDALPAEAARLGARIEVVSLLSAEAEVLRVPSIGRARPPAPDPPALPARVVRHRLDVTSVTARRGWDASDERALDEATSASAAAITDVRSGDRALVLGAEELMYAPMRLAAHLPGHVRFHSTTLSPIVASGRPGDPDYPIRSRAALGPRGMAPYVYNLGLERYDDVVVCCEVGTPVSEAALAVYARAAPIVHLVEVRERR